MTFSRLHLECPHILTRTDMATVVSEGEFTWEPGHDSDVFVVAFQVSNFLVFIWSDFALIMAYFEVENRGFRIDTQRLTKHCEFLRTMLTDSEGKLGAGDEGSPSKPIKVNGCTVMSTPQRRSRNSTKSNKSRAPFPRSFRLCVSPTHCADGLFNIHKIKFIHSGTLFTFPLGFALG